MTVEKRVFVGGQRMGEGVVFALVAAVWFVFRKRIAAYQVFLVTEKFKLLPVRDKAEQLRGVELVGTLFCALLFVAGVLLMVLRTQLG
ncbi:hypothetical protein [Arthrobacter sp. SAFR-044]|uniref:hypothetical protein n=1 Tax=Arthrobacter sp. SAFR-044 TaxID=3387278 RepID=UPI003F7B49A9